MRVGIATDHCGFAQKDDLVARLPGAGHDVVDLGADKPSPDDDDPAFVIPLAQAVAAETVERGVAICGSGAGASICTNQVPGIRAALIHDHSSAGQGVEDGPLNITCIRGGTVGPGVARDLVLPGWPPTSGEGATPPRARGPPGQSDSNIFDPTAVRPSVLPVVILPVARGTL